MLALECYHHPTLDAGEPWGDGCDEWLIIATIPFPIEGEVLPIERHLYRDLARLREFRGSGGDVLVPGKGIQYEGPQCRSWHGAITGSETDDDGGAIKETHTKDLLVGTKQEA